MDLSYLADTVVLLRYFEAFGEVRKAMSVVKRRSGDHERSVRELRISEGCRSGASCGNSTASSPAGSVHRRAGPAGPGRRRTAQRAERA